MKGKSKSRDKDSFVPTSIRQLLKTYDCFNFDYKFNRDENCLLKSAAKNEKPKKCFSIQIETEIHELKLQFHLIIITIKAALSKLQFIRVQMHLHILNWNDFANRKMQKKAQHITVEDDRERELSSSNFYFCDGLMNTFHIFQFDLSAFCHLSTFYVFRSLWFC